MRRRVIEEDRTRVYFYSNKKDKENYWDVEPARAARVDRKRKDYALGDRMDFFPKNNVPLDDQTQERILKALRGANGGAEESLAPEGLIAWREGPDQRCIWVNSQWYKLTGATWEETEGFGWANFLHPEDATKAMARYKQAVAERRPYACESRVRRRDGEWIWMRTHAVPRFGPHGELLGYDGSGLPIPGPNMMLTPQDGQSGVKWATISPSITQSLPPLTKPPRKTQKRKPPPPVAV